MPCGLHVDSVDRTLAPAALDPVVVNAEACRRLAEWLRSHEIPADREESSLPSFSPPEIANFYFFLVAMCHQTSPRGRPPLEGYVEGRRLRGWDYLSAKLEGAAQVNPSLLTPDFWAHITPLEMEDLFRDETLGSRLSDPPGRAALIRDLGERMLQCSWGGAYQLYDIAGGRIAAGDPNLIGLLAQFRAYRDPVRKKSYFFLAVMRNSGLWAYLDPDQLGAPVDYHEVRGHLRIGTVEICDPELRAKLVEGRDVTAEEDIRIRQAVHEAMMLLSEGSGLRNPSQLHYLFWNVFRSCCTRQDPHCYSCPPDCSLPARYVPLALLPDGSRRCPFWGVCASVGQEPKLVEHRIETDYY